MTTKENKIINHILKWEGGYANDPDDAGGATNSGITIATFRSVYGNDKTVEDLKKLTYGQWVGIFHKLFWNPLRAYDIAHPSVCMLIVDMA